MAALSRTVRAALVLDLSATLRRYAAAPAAACDAVIRLRDRAGCTWSDLIGPSRDGGVYAGQLAAYGMSVASGASPGECACGVLRHATWASPVEMARAAVLAHAAPGDRVAAMAELEALTLALMRREAAEGMNPAGILPVPRPSEGWP